MDRIQLSLKILKKSGSIQLSRNSFKLLVIFLLTSVSVGCASSPAGPIYINTEARGQEQELIGVVNGLWLYDVEQNESRLRKFLPNATDAEIHDMSERYQVRVGFDKKFLFGFGGSFVDVALLPEGWSHTTKTDAKSAVEVQPGDIVIVLGQKGRLVDKVIALHRRCNEAPTEEERPELSIGCFEVTEFKDSGYGGKSYFFSVF